MDKTNTFEFENENKNNTNANEDEEEFIESIGLKALNYMSVIERYYTKIYFNKNESTEQYLFIHSNGIALCGIGKNHFLLNKDILRVKDLNKITQIKGKKKNGARVLNEVEYVAEIEYVEKNEENKNIVSSVFKFNPGLKGVKLMEVNTNLYTNANLIQEYPEKFGYICIVFLDHKQVESWINKSHNLA